MANQKHLIGLLLGAEEDWPTALEALISRLGPVKGPDGGMHEIASERVTIEPFNLRDKVRQDLVVDRLAYWYYHPREWLKKAALMDDLYLLNSPFTFQSMEKHSAYCALMRMGMHVPETVLVPYKNPVDNVRWAYTAAKYNQSFELEKIADDLGYPLFMKPFDGGGWRWPELRDRDGDRRLGAGRLAQLRLGSGASAARRVRGPSGPGASECGRWARARRLGLKPRWRRWRWRHHQRDPAEFRPEHAG